MAASEEVGGPAPSSLDEELARLRAAGLTDGEITAILTGRRRGVAAGGTPGAAMPQAPVSGVMGNFSAIWTHARSIIPTMVAQIALVFDTSSTTVTRITALLAVIVKTAFVLAFAYVVLLEFNQLRSATDRARADACNARLQQLANSAPAFSFGSKDPKDELIVQRYVAQNEQWKKDCE